VVKGYAAIFGLALDIALKSVLLPAFGRPICQFDETNIYFILKCFMQ